MSSTTQWISAIGIFSVGLVLGYMLVPSSSESSSIKNNQQQQQQSTPQKKKRKPRVTDSSNSDGDIKLVLVVRNDLKMGKGKIAAQCGHATLGAYKEICENNHETHQKWLMEWESEAQPKIVLKVNSEREMQEISRKAKMQDLPNHIVMDAGRTQIASGSKTVLAIGPAPTNMVNGVTGKLKLL
eukprot:gb/GECH01000692.1/.p1 GENE.gb/GECH01000692.1/~~gb/GECH01000692.1/.p1  ORF type:complete len:184 (+),score=58.61 gb/GECH01000692.1/:1-552(+)